jgi:hypothetical protein
MKDDIIEGQNIPGLYHLLYLKKDKGTNGNGLGMYYNHVNYY